MDPDDSGTGRCGISRWFVDIHECGPVAKIRGDLNLRKDRIEIAGGSGLNQSYFWAGKEQTGEENN